MSKRKWSENYVAFGFTKNIGKDGTEKAQCILCDQVLTNSSLKPSELKIHSATHCESAAYGIEALKTKRSRYDQKGTLPQLHKTTTTMQKPMLMASYKAAYLIAKSKKAHNIGENFIKPCLVGMADILLRKEAARKLSKISMSDNTVKRRIEDMSNDILSQIVHGIKKSDFPIALQLDESTDVVFGSQLLVFVRYVQKAGTKLELKEEFLFCESLQTTATASDVMNLIKAFFEKHDIPLEKIGFACIDGAPAMLGCKSGFVTLLKEMNPNLVIIHSILHRYALMSKTLPNNLKEVMDSAVHIVNFIRGRATNHRLFKRLCEEMGTEHTVLLFHTNVRWRSRGKVFNRLFELRYEVLTFLKNCEKKPVYAANLESSRFLLRLAYLADIFSALNDLCISLQG